VEERSDRFGRGRRGREPNGTREYPDKEMVLKAFAFRERLTT
jgi:hypothetical protein